MITIPQFAVGGGLAGVVTSLFTNGEQGLWYDPSDLTSEKLAWVAANPGFTSAQFLAAFPTHTLYQNSTGTTPVTALGQPVGLVLDKSKGGLAALGSELVTNGTFDSNITGWTSQVVGSGTPIEWNSTGGGSIALQRTNVTNYGAGYQAITTVSGRTYKITASNVGGSSSFLLAVSSTTTVGENNVLPNITVAAQTSTIAYFTAIGSTSYVRLRAFADGTTAYADNISVREVPGVHATQATDAARPTLQARANLLIRTEEFSNAAWVKFNSSATADAGTAPDGTTTADKLIVNNGANSGFVYNGSAVPVTSGTVYTASVYVKAAELGFAFVCNNNRASSSAAGVCVNLTTGGTSNAGANGTYVVESAGNGWYRVSITATANTTSGYLEVSPLGAAGGYGSYTGNGTSGILVWGGQYVLGTSAGTYQRVVTATDYADVGLPRSLTFDGTDDSLVTPSVNFTATDKMTVCAGVFKNADAGVGAVAYELSISTNTENGSFGIYPEGTGASAGYYVASRGTARAVASATTYAAPILNVVSHTHDIAGDSVIVRINAAQVATSTADQGTGNYGTYPLYIGRRAGTSLPFNGRIHQLIVRGAATDTATIQQTERFVAQKTGVTL